MKRPNRINTFSQYLREVEFQKNMKELYKGLDFPMLDLRFFKYNEDHIGEIFAGCPTYKTFDLSRFKGQNITSMLKIFADSLTPETFDIERY